MMKRIIFAALGLLISTGAFAQMDWGVKAGLNLATLTNSDLSDGNAKMKPSFYAGVFAEFGINRYLSIQPEVIYSRQGTYYKWNDHKQWSRLNYLNIPVLAKLYIVEGLSLDLGPQFGFMLNSKNKIKNTALDIDDKYDIDGTKNFDVSFAMGLGYKITRYLDVSARYNLGLTKVLEWDGDKIKNSVLQFGMGYRF